MDAASKASAQPTGLKYKRDTSITEQQQHMKRKTSSETLWQKPKTKWTRMWESETNSSSSVAVSEVAIANSDSSANMSVLGTVHCTNSPTKQKTLGERSPSNKKVKRGSLEQSHVETLTCSSNAGTVRGISDSTDVRENKLGRSCGPNVEYEKVDPSLIMENNTCPSMPISQPTRNQSEQSTREQLIDKM